jgi:hypothetical protein
MDVVKGPIEEISILVLQFLTNGTEIKLSISFTLKTIL